MPSHGLPPQHTGGGPRSRTLVSETVNVANDGTIDTGLGSVDQVTASPAVNGPYNVAVYKTGGATGGTLYFEVYDIGASTDQGSAVDVDYIAIGRETT